MKIKAISVPEKCQVEIIEVDSPAIENPTDVKVKMYMTGVCGSDMHFYHGTLAVAEYPRIIGHEGVGEVIEIGSAVKSVSVGDIVIGEPLLACGECYSCKMNRPNACFTMKSRGCHVDGCFREHTVYPEMSVHKIPSNVSLEDAALIEPYSIAAQACFRGRITSNDSVWIMGAGPIGLTIADVALNVYGANVIISDLVDSRLERAKKLGVKHVLNAKNVDVEAEVKNIAGAYGPNVILDAVCIPKTFEQAVKMVSPGGRVVCLSFSTDTVTIMPLDITRKELDIVGSRHQTYKFKEAISWFENKKIHPEVLVSSIFKYTQIKDALFLMENDLENSCKVLLDWR